MSYPARRRSHRPKDHTAGRRAQLRRRRELTALSQPACWSWEVTRDALDAAYRARQCNDARDVLMHWQLGRCAICAAPDRWLVLDHDHDSGLVRGLLCESCNCAEGWRDLPVIAKYRHIHPAYILDLRVRYVAPYSRR